jgi:Trk K+ transport system NAD-binding subunit|tara:strand:+ start:464 stop:2356 length:1893 start_codon:yes stop_codon:yes gene_type:complete
MESLFSLIKAQTTNMLKYIQYHFENKITRSSNFILFLFLTAGFSAFVLFVLQSTIGLNATQNFFNVWWDNLTSILKIKYGKTTDSKIIDVLIWGLNIAISGLIIAFLTNKFSAFINKLNKGHSMIIDKNHYVIIGWNANIFQLLDELKHSQLDQARPTVLCFNSMDNIEMRTRIDLEYPNQKQIRILTRSGDSYNIKELSILNLTEAKSIMVLHDELKPSYSIETTLLAVSQNISNANTPPIIAEFNDDTNMEVLTKQKEKSIYGVHTNSIIASITSQSIRNRHIASVFLDFLDYDGDEIYFYPGNNFKGMSIREVANSIQGATLIGVFINNKCELNPHPNKLISEGEELIVIAANDNIKLTGHEIVSHEKMHYDVFLEDIEDNNTKRSILVLGWSELGRQIIDESLNMIEKGSKIIISYRSDILNEESLGLNKSEDFIIRYSPFKKNNVSLSLEYLRQNKIDTILILGYNDHFTPDISDTYSLMQNLQLKDVLSEMNPEEKPRVILQLNDGSKQDLIDVEENNEFIVSNILTSLLMSQLANNPILGVIFDELFSPKGCEIYINPIEKYLNISNIKFIKVSELINYCLDRNETFIGYIASNDLVLNPPKNDSLQISTKDLEIIIISHENL